MSVDTRPNLLIANKHERDAEIRRFVDLLGLNDWATLGYQRIPLNIVGNGGRLNRYSFDVLSFRFKREEVYVRNRVDLHHLEKPIVTSVIQTEPRRSKAGFLEHYLSLSSVYPNGDILQLKDVLNNPPRYKLEGVISHQLPEAYHEYTTSFRRYGSEPNDLKLTHRYRCVVHQNEFPSIRKLKRIRTSDLFDDFRFDFVTEDGLTFRLSILRDNCPTFEIQDPFSFQELAELKIPGFPQRIRIAKTGIESGVIIKDVPRLFQFPYITEQTPSLIDRTMYGMPIIPWQLSKVSI